MNLCEFETRKGKQCSRFWKKYVFWVLCKQHYKIVMNIYWKRRVNNGRERSI